MMQRSFATRGILIDSHLPILLFLPQYEIILLPYAQAWGNRIVVNTSLQISNEISWSCVEWRDIATKVATIKPMIHKYMASVPVSIIT